MADIILFLQGQSVIQPESVTVGINDQSLTEVLTETQELKFNVNLINGKNTLWVRLNTKDSRNTTRDQQGNVINETFVEINNISIEPYLVSDEAPGEINDSLFGQSTLQVFRLLMVLECYNHLI
jgi:hypothetical protein